MKITKSELEGIIREEIKGARPARAVRPDRGLRGDPARPGAAYSEPGGSKGGPAGQFDPTQRGTFKTSDPVVMELYDKLSLRITGLEGKLGKLLTILQTHFGREGRR